MVVEKNSDTIKHYTNYSSHTVSLVTPSSVLMHWISIMANKDGCLQGFRAI